MTLPSDDPFDWIRHELEHLERDDLRRTLLERDRRQGPQVEFDGRRLVNFGSNDYLSLAGDPRLAAAARETIDREGCGAGASPLLAGRSAAHVALERRLAEFEGAEAALLFSSGFAANLGAITALVERGDAVFSDQLNHASLIDGCRLSRAEVFVYPHRDVARLDAMLGESPGFRRRLIVTESLFSMDGDRAPLAGLADLARRHEAMLLVDEAHATGVFGAGGRGACEAAGIDAGIHVRVGTLSKALGGAGGFVCGRREMIEWLVNRARSYIFSTAFPAATAAAANAALGIVEQEPDRRRRLLGRADELRAALTSQGWDVGESASQIVPVVVGSSRAALDLAATLLEQGLWAPAIRPPSVPQGAARLRISLCHGHTPEMIERLVAALAASAASMAARPAVT